MTCKNTNINVIIGTILSLIFVLFSFAGSSFFEKPESRFYDIGSAFVGDENHNSDKIALIEIDDRSLDKLGSWPWPRRIIADMIDTLNKKGAALIGLNIPFDEMEHNEGLEELKIFRERYDAYPTTTDDLFLKKWALDNLDQIEKKIDNDSILLSSVKNAGNVILPVYTMPQANNNDGDKISDDSFLFKNALNSSNISSSLKERISIDRLISPYPELGKNAAGLGYIESIAMGNVSDRSYPAYLSYKGMLLPSFPLRLALSYLKLQPKDLTIRDDRIIIKERLLPLTKGEMLIKFGDIKRRYSFADILDNKSLGADLKGKIILIGFNDYKSRRFDMPGVMTETQLNARLLDNIINSGLISRPYFMTYLEALSIFVIGIGLSFIFGIKGRMARPSLVSGILLLIISATFVISMAMGLWLKTVYMVGCLVSVYLVLTIKDIVISGLLRRESPEESRLLGLSYQSQWLPDNAFDKFKRLPSDNNSKELIYNLGLECEQKAFMDKALEVYEYIAGKGGYKDIEDRISRLKASHKSSLMDNFAATNGFSKVSDPGENIRSKVGRYELLGVLGKGSMGLVYKARDPEINSLAAIKTIRFSDEFDDDVIQDIKERFFREAETARQLSHPSIVTIHDVGEDQDLTYMAMEFLEGEDLDDFITKGNLLSFRRVLDVVGKTAEALDYAHKANVIHRDIKPANVMLLKNGNIKVTDFSIAKAISFSRTKTGGIPGIPDYMSPEQIMGQKIDSRSDIFSLGVLFYQLITGELPFHGDNLSALLYQITQIKHPSPRSYNPKIPNIYEQILDKALAKDPTKRFKSAGEMARVINLLGQRIDQMRVEKQE